MELVKMERKRVLHSPQPIIVVDLFPEVLGELVELLTGLSAEEWNKPTACPGWSVKDVALHLLGVEVGNLAWRRDGHATGVSLVGWEELVTFINAWNQEWVQVARRISSRLLIDLLQFTGVQMCEYFRSLDPHALHDLCNLGPAWPGHPARQLSSDHWLQARA
jgi:uncharacterized protein (TIGR03083 family)